MKAAHPSLSSRKQPGCEIQDHGSPILAALACKPRQLQWLRHDGLYSARLSLTGLRYHKWEKYMPDKIPRKPKYCV